jgi:hypothetical protein
MYETIKRRVKKVLGLKLDKCYEIIELANNLVRNPLNYEEASERLIREMLCLGDQIHGQMIYGGGRMPLLLFKYKCICQCH